MATPSPLGALSAPSAANSPGPRRDYVSIGLWIALVVSCVIWALPFVFMVFTSLKSQADITSTAAWAPPPTWEWGNYSDASERGDLVTTAKNSAFIAVIKVPLGLLIAAAAAFALARLQFGFNRAVLAVFALGAVVPVQVALGPLFTTMEKFDLLDSTTGIILPYLAFGLPYQIFFLYGFFRAIPLDLDEAARIDGAGNVRVFFQIMLPLAVPALAALFILDLVATWNEYAMALTLLQDQDSWTVPLALQNFNTQFSSAYGPLNAFIVLSILPVLIVYLLFQRFFTSGALAGAVKG